MDEVFTLLASQALWGLPSTPFHTTGLFYPLSGGQTHGEQNKEVQTPKPQEDSIIPGAYCSPATGTEPTCLLETF